MSGKTDMQRRYRQSLVRLPTPGHGEGFHSGILRVGNYGRLAGLRRERVQADLKQKVQRLPLIPGRNLVIEIEQAVNKAFGWDEDMPTRSERRQPTAPCKKGPRGIIRPPKRHRYGEKKTDAHKAIEAQKRWEIHKGRVITEADLLAASPVPIPSVGGPLNLQAAMLVRAIFSHDAFVFIGQRYDTKVERAERWARGLGLLANISDSLPHICPNAFNGTEGRTKNGKLSHRASSCIHFARILVVEFDHAPLSEQLSFFAFAPLPILALIHSGSKSIHAWLDLSKYTTDRRGASDEEWKRIVDDKLKPALFLLGADPHTFHKGCLSRLPGHFRKEKGQYQRLLYLNPTPCASAIFSSREVLHEELE